MVVGIFCVVVGLFWLVVGLFCIAVGGGRWWWIYFGWWWVYFRCWWVFFWVVAGSGGFVSLVVGGGLYVLSGGG